MATSIPRMKFRPKSEDTFKSERQKLAEEAAKKLNYDVLANAISRPQTLLYALHSLGIEPLDTDKVEAYKKSKEKHGMWSGTRNVLLLLLGMVTGVAIAFANWLSFGLNHWYNIVLQVFSICGAVFCLILFFVYGDGWGHGHRKSREWMKFSIGSYQRPIPEYVLSRAIQIKDYLPSASFNVEQLGTTYSQRHYPPKFNPDPFLIVYDKGESYYVDVWDEKGYEL